MNLNVSALTRRLTQDGGFIISAVCCSTGQVRYIFAVICHYHWKHWWTPADLNSAFPKKGKAQNEALNRPIGWVVTSCHSHTEDCFHSNMQVIHIYSKCLALIQTSHLMVHLIILLYFWWLCYIAHINWKTSPRFFSQKRKTVNALNNAARPPLVHLCK